VYGRNTNENDVLRLKWLPIQERISLSLVKLEHKALKKHNIQTWVIENMLHSHHLEGNKMSQSFSTY